VKKAFVMILDDDPFLRKALQSMLFRQACTVRALECPQEALEFLELGDRPDLVISDLEMPGMSGSEFCTIVREKYGSIPFVLISGSPSVYDLGKLCKADRTFMKPFRRDDLLDILHDIGHGQ
jgi:CheY-like chemotaxis protein